MTQHVDFMAGLETGQKIDRRSKLLDMEAVKARFAPYSEAIDLMFREAREHEVRDEESLKAAIAMAGQAQALEKKIDAQRKAIVEEPNRFVKSVNGFASDFLGRLKEIVQDLKKKISDYQYAQELARREAERKAQEEAKLLQEKLNRDAESKGVQAPVVPAPVLPEPPRVTRTETGTSAHIRKEWTFRVVEPAQVPREYCVPDERLIRQAVKMGVREIPGVEIYEEARTVLRT